MEAKWQALQKAERAVEALGRSGTLELVEDSLSSNADAATLRCNLAYAVASLHFLRQRAAGTLQRDDPILRLMKKVQERTARAAALRQRLEESRLHPAPTLAKRDRL